MKQHSDYWMPSGGGPAEQGLMESQAYAMWAIAAELERIADNMEKE